VRATARVRHPSPTAHTYPKCIVDSSHPSVDGAMDNEQQKVAHEQDGSQKRDFWEKPTIIVAEGLNITPHTRHCSAHIPFVVRVVCIKILLVQDNRPHQQQDSQRRRAVPITQSRRRLSHSSKIMGWILPVMEGGRGRQAGSTWGLPFRFQDASKLAALLLQHPGKRNRIRRSAMVYPSVPRV
jgi:hypothetical protein